MRRTVSLLLALALASSAAVAGERHLASARVIDGRLAEAASRRSGDVAAIQALLDTPRARATARALGVSAETLRGGVPALADAELRELARRSAALRGDPLSGDVSTNDLLVVILVVAIVVLVFAAVD